jgi:pimeloyl-ACP methyl ester carboxylesterase
MPRIDADGVELLPGSELMILRDCYHAAHRENAPVWNAAVLDFLSRHGL